MFVTNHALAGAAVGLVLRRPAAAFATGIASHVAMDMVHHWGEPGIDWDDFLKVARVDGVVGIAVAAAVAAVRNAAHRRSMLWIERPAHQHLAAAVRPQLGEC